MRKTNRLIEKNKSRIQLFQPVFYCLTNTDDGKGFYHLIEQRPFLKGESTTGACQVTFYKN